MDASVILGIPLCARRQDDFWAWNFDRKGLFVVCSAYRMMVAKDQQRELFRRQWWLI
jgi:hypothetical protein